MEMHRVFWHLIDRLRCPITQWDYVLDILGKATVELRGNWESAPGISQVQVNVDASGRPHVAPLGSQLAAHYAHRLLVYPRHPAELFPEYS